MPMNCEQLKTSGEENVQEVRAEPDVKLSKPRKLFNAGVSGNSKTGKSTDPTCYSRHVELKKEIDMTLTVQGGWLDGSLIRKARKQYRCQYWRGKQNGGTCKKPIMPGDYYVEGEMSDAGQTRNGVFLLDKYCPECAGPEAVASLPQCEAV